MAKRPLILITRPQPQASRFAETLDEILKGTAEIQIAPLSRFELIEQPIDGAQYAGAIFTSANGVRAADVLWNGRRGDAYAVGDRTAQVARAAGWDAISARGNAGDLAGLIAANVVSGIWAWPCGVARTDSFDELENSTGIKIDRLVVYEMKPCAGDLSDFEGRRLIVPVFSENGGALLRESLASSKGEITVIALSPKVAAGFGGDVSVEIAQEPNEISVTQRILATLADPKS